MEIITISKEELFSGIRSLLSEVLATQLDEPQPKEQLLTKKDVAIHFKVDISTIGRWMNENKLKPYYQGSKVYFKNSELPFN
jgi:hypothetical protein